MGSRKFTKGRSRVVEQALDLGKVVFQQQVALAEKLPGQARVGKTVVLVTVA